MAEREVGEVDGETGALSELQLDVLRVLWRDGERSVAEIVRALRGARDLAHTTVATVLTRLERRGVVASRREGRQLIYAATVEEPAVRRSMVSGLVRSLFGGSGGALVAHLVAQDDVSPADVAELRRLLDDSERGRG